MNPDLNNLIIVDAKVQQDTEHGSVDLLYPFISALANSGRVSRLKLKKGNEDGVSLSLDGNHLIINFSVYSFISRENEEQLCYEYRISDAQGRYSQNTAVITLSLDERDSPTISTATLTTNNALDYIPANPDESDSLAKEESLEGQAATHVLEDMYDASEEEQNPSLYESGVDTTSNDTWIESEVCFKELSTEPVEQGGSHDILENEQETNLHNNEIRTSDDKAILELEEYDVEPLIETPIEDDDELDTAHQKDDESKEEEAGGEEIIDVISLAGDDDNDNREPETVSSISVEDPLLIEEPYDEPDESSVTFHFIPQSIESESAEEPENSEEAEPASDEDVAIDPFSYDELATELPSTDSSEPENDINLDQIISEVDQAISEADRLMDSALHIQADDADSRAEFNLIPDDDSSETALSGLIDKLPEDSSEEIEFYNEAEEELEHLIERLPDNHTNDDGEGEGDKPYGEVAAHREHIGHSKPYFNQQVSITGTGTYVFDIADFDPGRLGLNQVRIDTLPLSGGLLYNREPAQENQVIQKNELLTGRLSFNPELTDDEADSIHFTYSVCFGDQDFSKLSSIHSSDLLVTIDISANTEDSLVSSGDIKVISETMLPQEFIAGSIQGTYGELTINNNGYWVYEASRDQSALQNLTQTSQLTETFSVPLENGNSYTVSFYICGPLETAKLILPS